MKAVALTQQDGTVVYVNPEHVVVVLVKTRKLTTGVIWHYARLVLTSGGYIEVDGPAYDVVQKLQNA